MNETPPLPTLPDLEEEIIYLLRKDDPPEERIFTLLNCHSTIHIFTEPITTRALIGTNRLVDGFHAYQNNPEIVSRKRLEKLRIRDLAGKGESRLFYAGARIAQITGHLIQGSDAEKILGLSSEQRPDIHIINQATHDALMGLNAMIILTSQYTLVRLQKKAQEQ